jgi:superfamily II DNA or RNA helicase
MTRERTAELAAMPSSKLRWFGAIAVEQSLSRTVLVKIATKTGESIDPLLAEATGSGLLVMSPVMLGREPAYAVAPQYEQLVLRELSRREELHEIARATRLALSARSISDLICALQDGDLVEVERLHAAPRLRDTQLAPVADWLHQAICNPFDADWLSRAWGNEATRVGARVLRDSLESGLPCDELRSWLASRRATLSDSTARLIVEEALCQQALLRGELESIEELSSRLARPMSLGLRAAARFVEGDLARAQALLDEATEVKSASKSKRVDLPDFGGVAPILAMMLCSRDTEEATARAKRLLPSSSGTAKAFKTLLKYLAQPEETHRRIDFFAVSNGAGVWEILLSALTVKLHVDQATTRASWAVQLVRRSVVWAQNGYHWLARQALSLALDLHEPHTRQELSAHAPNPALSPRPKELSLWELVSPKPEWKKALLALEAVSDAITEGTDLAYRVAWFLDMSDGSFNLPALQEYRVSAGGWSQGQRLTLAQLYESKQGLPPEDLRVLDCTRETPDGKRALLPEAHEMLIGHPRVFNGVRGTSHVEVVRGSCRVETEDEPGHIRVVVEPEGAFLGVNVVVKSESRLVVYRVSKAMKRVIDALPHGVRIPKAQEPEVLRVLGKLAQSVEVKSPALGAERTVVSNSTPCLRIAPKSGGWLVQLGVRPFGEKGRFFVAGVGRVSVTYAIEGQRLRCERDLALERSRVDALIAACPVLLRDPEEEPDPALPGDFEESWFFGEEPVLTLLAELRDAKIVCDVEWPESSALKLRGQASSKSLHGRLRCIKGWYIATGGVQLDDVTEVAIEELARAPATMSGRFLRLDDGDYVEIEARIRRVVAALGAVSTGKRGDDLRIHPGAVTTLTELTAARFEADETTASWLTRVAEVGAKTYDVPADLNAELRSYQVEGYRWLRRLAELGLGACLADDMGLGKTLQILAVLLTRKDRGPALVVAPTSVCSNWVLEMQRFAPTLRPMEYIGKDRDSRLASVAESKNGTVVICSYALLQQDADSLAAVPWDTVVLDEAQFIKNAESLRAKAAYRLVARQRIAATGTPVENHFGDLWSIFQFLNPGLLGDWKSYKRRFVLPFERDGVATPEVELRDLVRPYVLRRLKRDVLKELPPLTEVEHSVHLGRDDGMRYALLRKKIQERLFTAHGKRNGIDVLAEISKLRRFCCHPKLVFPDAPVESAKIQTFLELVEELVENQHRALVFSQYVDFLALVREALDERKISYEYLDGGTSRTARQAGIDAFQGGSASLFLISLKAGGFGLNLTAADYVIHLDPWWNPAVEAQATDRAHRIGQERRVTVYRLVTKDTIEEQIVALHRKKQKLATSLLEGSDAAADLTTEDLVELIGGRDAAAEEAQTPD